jgi:thiol-disulfide isomerase/thioredoxin
MVIGRRTLLAAGGAAAWTLTGALWARKPLAQELHALDTGLRPVDPPVGAPDIVFLDAKGEEHRLSDFRGHGMVINLWATWCAPCVAEMPSLAALSKSLAPEDIAVLPLSSDRGGAKAVEAFFAAHGVTGLPVLLDPKGAAMRAFGARGIPTSFLIDKAGRERARLEGSADWSSPAAVAAVKRLIAGSA